MTTKMNSMEMDLKSLLHFQERGDKNQLKSLSRWIRTMFNINLKYNEFTF